MNFISPIKSKGGHAAAPHLTADTILVASHLVVSLQQIISRNHDPFSPSVLIHYFVPGWVYHQCHSIRSKADGHFRAMDEAWRFKAHEIIGN